MAKKPKLPLHPAHPEGEYYGQKKPGTPQEEAKAAIRSAKGYPEGATGVPARKAARKVQKTFGRG